MMINGGLLRQLVAVVLLLAVFGLRLNMVSRSGFVVPLQDFISKVACISDADTKPQAGHIKLKNPGVDLPVACSDFILVEKSVVSRIGFPSFPLRGLPEGYVTIFIPPA